MANTLLVQMLCAGILSLLIFYLKSKLKFHLNAMMVFYKKIITLCYSMIFSSFWVVLKLTIGARPFINDDFASLNLMFI